MHPVILGLVARDHVRSLIEEAETARLARMAPPRASRLRRQLGRGLIAVGSKLAREQARGLAGAPGARV